MTIGIRGMRICDRSHAYIVNSIYLVSISLMCQVFPGLRTVFILCTLNTVISWNLDVFVLTDMLMLESG